MADQFLAHSTNETGAVDPLRRHLFNVARIAYHYAQPLGLQDEAFIAGMLHDIAKYGKLFQKRLIGEAKKIDHWSAGAYLALTKYKLNGVAAALVIDGHHIGLQQGSSNYLKGLKPEKLQNHHPLGLRLSESKLDVLMERFEKDGLSLPDIPSDYQPSFSIEDKACASSMLDLRMLYSTLVDADFIDTEAHFQAIDQRYRNYRTMGRPLEPERLAKILSSHVSDLSSKVNASESIKRIRSMLLEDCQKAALQLPGLFTMTAPTGSGKTLSMLAFALDHAAANGLRRIVVVIPYLSIIEQTARQYRKALSATTGDIEHLVLEDHSMARVDWKSNYGIDSEDEVTQRSKLLAENWDAPIIVTTSVQFFESLFANKSSSCRKLHRMAKSVILFDEVQTLPLTLSVPTLATLSHLSQRYGSTVVFSTATQPAFNHLDGHTKALCANGWIPKEIVRDAPTMFRLARRVKVHGGSFSEMVKSWDEIAEEMISANQSLCIVNLKRHALELYDTLQEKSQKNCFHISTNMCPNHRKRVLDQVRQLLTDGDICHLVATQCVEAGVDIDFPVVFRSWGPLDALTQAAGRCNRNGRLTHGIFKIFVPEDEAYPDPVYKQAAGVTRLSLDKRLTNELDLNDPEIFQQYYRELYMVMDWEETQLVKAIKLKDFASTADSYKMIPKRAINVLVPYDREKYFELSEEVEKSCLSRRWIHRARPYSVSLFKPKPDDPICNHLDKIRLGRKSFSEDWFIYLTHEHYFNDVGLKPPLSTECLIA